MPVDEAPDDDNGVRQSYNFAPGYHGLVYRADGPEYGHRDAGDKVEKVHRKHDDQVKKEEPIEAGEEGENVAVSTEGHNDTKYKLQSMKWGKLAKNWGCMD